MAIVALDESNFRRTLAREGIVLVDCRAEWCGACRDFRPVYERVAARNVGHIFAELDTQKERGLREELEVGYIPSLLLFRDGFLLFNQPGYYGEKQLEDILRKAERLDMDRVREDASAGGRSKI